MMIDETGGAVEGNNKKVPEPRFAIDIEGIRSLKVAKIFRDNTDRINHLDYSSDGELLITSSDDDQIIIYECMNGVQKKVTNSKKYGVDLITFTHQNTTCVHASNKLDDTIRYLSLHDNKYLRYFPGHTKKVTTICMSPCDDTFLSGSMDKTLRLWDLRSPNCHGFMQLPGTPATSFDPEGLIFAAGVNNEMVKLYDLRSFDKGPFSNFKFLQSEHEWNSLKFSPDGKTILLVTSSCLRIIDAFNGKPLFTLDGFANTSNACLEAGYTPDGKFIYSGSTDGQVHFWAADSDLKIHSINSEHPGPIRCIKFNPKYYTLASSCTNLALWLPTADHFTD